MKKLESALGGWRKFPRPFRKIAYIAFYCDFFSPHTQSRSGESIFSQVPVPRFPTRLREFLPIGPNGGRFCIIMTPALWITAAGIAIAALITLWVNASNRAQQRQIELWKKDPSIPIKPPPHRLFSVAKAYGLPIISVCLSIYYLYEDVVNPAPVTRRDVFTMVLEGGAIVFMLNFMIIMFVFRTFGKFVGGVLQAFSQAFKK